MSKINWQKGLFLIYVVWAVVIVACFAPKYENKAKEYTRKAKEYASKAKKNGEQAKYHADAPQADSTTPPSDKIEPLPQPPPYNIQAPEVPAPPPEDELTSRAMRLLAETEPQIQPEQDPLTAKANQLLRDLEAPDFPPIAGQSDLLRRADQRLAELRAQRELTPEIRQPTLLERADAMLAELRGEQIPVTPPTEAVEAESDPILRALAKLHAEPPPEVAPLAEDNLTERLKSRLAQHKWYAERAKKYASQAEQYRDKARKYYNWGWWFALCDVGLRHFLYFWVWLIAPWPIYYVAKWIHKKSATFLLDARQRAAGAKKRWQQAYDKRRITIIAGLIVFLTVALFPEWDCIQLRSGQDLRHPIGRHIIWPSPERMKIGDSVEMRSSYYRPVINYHRALLEMAIVVVLTLGLFFVLGDGKDRQKETDAGHWRRKEG